MPSEVITAPATSDPLEEEPWEVQRRRIPLKVDVEWLDFEHFKNRYSEKEGLAIIEVLCGHSQINQEVTKENARRARGRRDIRQPTPNPKLAVDGDTYWMQRIRIQSPELIQLLSRLTGHHDKWVTDKPRTFFAPFRAFWYHLPQLKRCLELLEAKWASTDEALGQYASPKSPISHTKVKNNQSGKPLDDNQKSSIGSDIEDEDDDAHATNADNVLTEPTTAISGELTGSSKALAHLRKFVEFIERHIVPQWRRASGTTQRKFRFADLWMAFQPGELIHVPMSSDSTQNSDVAPGSNSRMYQATWRLYTMDLDEVRDDKPDDTQKNSKRKLDLYTYYFDYDGNSYVPASHTFFIKDYVGERDITSLEVYPLRFVKDAENMKGALLKQGSWFREVITKKHVSYDGWTLTHGPTGATSESGRPLAVEHIDGDVIIDFVEGYKSEPTLGMGPSSWNRVLSTFDDSDWLSGDDDVFIMHWKFAAGSSRLEICDGKPIKDLDEDELMLLPRRVVAYAFRGRRFVMLDIESLSDPPQTDDFFQDLKINQSHKRMVISLVKSNLENQTTQKLRPTVSLNQDLIRGKGSGLVILLHGVPGVGKTATAEAVAQANKKPLFVITCGDLGFTAKDVENALKNIFRLAHLWDCILLLDEADIFLSRRELGDLKRNALVSVFLRVLEYYSGILFLTTNRVGTLDEAFKSRIHVSLYYPRLNRRQTLDIFQVNIRKLQGIVKEKQKLNAELDADAPKPDRLIIDGPSILDYAKWHFDIHRDTPERRWNGRQIRNAFQIAYSLAQFDMQSTALGEQDEIDEGADDGVTPYSRVGENRLDWRQFDMVAKAIERFEDYLYHATQGTDVDRARKGQLREDEYDPQQTPQTPAYNPLPSYQQRPPRQQQQQAPARRLGQKTTGPKPGAQYQPPYRPPGVEQETPVRRSEQQQQQQPQQRPHPRKPNTRAPPPRVAPSSSQYSNSQASRSNNTNRQPPKKRNDSRWRITADQDAHEGSEGYGTAGDGYKDGDGEDGQGYFDDAARWDEEGMETRY
ncbi:hypothetical protein BDV11DRAFT_215286 [Aspergillus similis]